jgi:hypothetical protein
MFMDSTIVTLASIILGTVGTTLGLVNFVIDRLEKRVRIRVIAKVGAQVHGGYLATTKRENWTEGSIGQLDRAVPALEIVNISSFPITINEVGYMNFAKQGRAAFIQPTAFPNGPLPYRLQPREAVTFYAERDQVGNHKNHSWKYAYVETSCGMRIKSRLKDFPFRR